MPSRPRVLLADDHALLLGAYEKLLADDCEIVGQVADGRALVDSAGGSVKVAIVMHRAKVGREDAIRRIAEAGGLIRRVVGDP